MSRLDRLIDDFGSESCPSNAVANTHKPFLELRAGQAGRVLLEPSTGFFNADETLHFATSRQPQVNRKEHQSQRAARMPYAWVTSNAAVSSPTLIVISPSAVGEVDPEQVTETM